MRYTKPPRTFLEQHDLLVARGLFVPDSERVLHWLRNVSYYRLSAYFLPFKQGDVFKEGVTFDQIADLYIFDRNLRLVLLDAIERIEVALRTALTYEIALRQGPFGYSNRTAFAPAFRHSSLMDELRDAEARSKETFVAHYRSKYTDETFLPIWMASELLSFGWMSRIYAASDSYAKRKIAGRFAVHDALLVSWLHSLSYVRNVCAHHSRLWNRVLAVRPAIPRRSPAWPYQVPSTDRLYCILVIVGHCLLRIAPECDWRGRLLSLLDTHPQLDLSAMHFPAGWRAMPPWSTTVR